MVEEDAPGLEEKVTSTGGVASSVKPSPRAFTGVFHKHDEKHHPEKPIDAQVDDMPADSVHPVGFTELFR